MGVTVGRVALSTPLSMRRIHPRRVSDKEAADGAITASDTGRPEATFMLEGWENGDGAAATVAALDLEGRRVGSVYVTDAAGNLPEGYYELGAVEVEYPSGAPKKRPWSFPLTWQPEPVVTRQAPDDNVAGADTADRDCEEAEKVVYTPTTSEVVVLDPRNVAGAEEVNLPQGTWKCIVRVRQVTDDSALLRWRTVDLAGATLVSGSQVAVGVADDWVELDLGTITVASADHAANWFVILVQGITSELGDVWIDRVRLVPA